MATAKRKATDQSELMTVDEFMAWDDGKGGRFELVDGVPRAMAPASDAHGTIQSNLGRIIGNHLAAPGIRCRIVTEPGIETRIRAKHNTRIPDFGVTCAPNEVGSTHMPAPVLLIEIMSPSNKRDTWDNVWAYVSIPTVQEILIVQSTRIEAQLLRRQADGSWPPDPVTIGADGDLALTSIGFTAPLAAAYAKTYLVT
jgi:Uma2 family endonuclease